MPMVVRHECPLPKLVNTADKIMDSGATWTCPICTRTWVCTWINAYGMANTQPQWLCTAPPGGGSVGQQVAALAVRVSTIEARGLFVQTVHVARADGVTVALGSSIDVTFTWPTPFGDTAYSYEAPVPPSLLGKVTVTEKSKTTTAVVLTLKSNSLAVSAFSWQATAWKVG